MTSNFLYWVLHLISCARISWNPTLLVTLKPGEYCFCDYKGVRMMVSLCHFTGNTAQILRVERNILHLKEPNTYHCIKCRWLSSFCKSYKKAIIINTMRLNVLEKELQTISPWPISQLFVWASANSLPTTTAEIWDDAIIWALCLAQSRSHSLFFSLKWERLRNSELKTQWNEDHTPREHHILEFQQVHTNWFYI